MTPTTQKLRENGTENPAETHPEACVTRRSDDRLRALYQSTPNAVILIDDDLQLRSFNPAAQRLFGPAIEDAAGQGAVSGRKAVLHPVMVQAETGFGQALEILGIGKQDLRRPAGHLGDGGTEEALGGRVE